MLSSNGSDAPLATASPIAPAVQMSKFAVALPLGPPDQAGKLLQDQLRAAIEKKNITVAKLPTDKSEYTLRGYVVSGLDKGKSKISYIWDVTNGAEKQVHRISGEEVIAAVKGKDQWTGLTAQVAELIASKTATSVATWLPTQAPAAAASVPMANNAASPSLSTPAALPVASAVPLAPATQTGSISRGPATVMSNVIGAPGDGNSSLAAAIQGELRKNGVALASTPDAQTYRVEGKVAVAQGKEGKQPIAIDWTVVDPAGKKLGVVSQKNDIPQGSVDGAWGQTATAAAEAAAKGIIRLLPSASAAAVPAQPKG